MQSLARGRLVSAVTAALNVGARAPVPPAPAVQRETVGLVVMAFRAGLRALMRVLLLLWLLPTGDEGRQPLDIAFGGRVALLRTLRHGRRLLGEVLFFAR